MPEAKRWWLWILPSILVVALDQISKQVVQESIHFGQPVALGAYLDLVLVFNPGAAFSFLSAQSGWQRPLFIGIALAASGLIVALLRRHVRQPLFCLALSLVLGGAVGNLIDRVMLGAVVDFIYFHLGSLGWPAFNLADSAITGGVILLLWDSLRRSGGHAGG